MDAPLDLVDGRKRVFGSGEVDLDMILGTGFPRAVFRKRMARTGDYAPAGRGEPLHRRVADPAARPGEEQSPPRLIGGGVRHEVAIRSILKRLYRRFPRPAGYGPAQFLVRH